MFSLRVFHCCCASVGVCIVVLLQIQINAEVKWQDIKELAPNQKILATVECVSERGRPGTAIINVSVLILQTHM